MYFLTKFCRICIQSDVKLLDLDTLDFDEVKLSKKLESCTRTVLTQENFSSEICMQCITKLRISYQFNDMFRRSNITLQKYLNTLLCDKKNVTPDNFINTELSIFVTPLDEFEYMRKDSNSANEISSNENYHREKRKRITKEQRCSLLKMLLTPSEIKTHDQEKIRCNTRYYNVQPADCFRGLKNIISFTQNYEFGWNLDKNSNYKTTPLDKLKAFSSDFFKRDFSEFKNTILYIIENNYCDSGDSADEYGLNIPEEKVFSNSSLQKFEEVIVEPDLKIKTEIDYEEDEYSRYNDNSEIKEEMNETNFDNDCSGSTSNIFFSDYRNQFSSINDSMQYLNNFVGSFQHRRTFSPNNVRCRTRDNPYINPKLKEQFLNRCFWCEKCNRYFKSPGYLKAHCSKVHALVDIN